MNLERFKLQQQPRLLFCTGAGLSAESGICTFREANGEGLWDEYDLNIVCNIAKFSTHYNTVHRFYNKRRTELANVHPNAAHQFISDMEKLYGEDRVMHITANVDDLVERCGGTAMHVHGSLLEIVEPFTWEGYDVINIGYNEYTPKEGIVAKPAVVMFGEQWRYENGRRKDIYADMLSVVGTMKPQDTIVVIGSSDTVLNWSGIVGAGTESYTINVNPEEHEMDLLFNQNFYKPATQAIDDVLEVVSKRM